MTNAVITLYRTDERPINNRRKSGRWISIKLGALDLRVDTETGSLLFYRKDFHGIPDTVLNGDGFTVELVNNEVVMIDIYDAKRVLSHLLKYGLSVADDTQANTVD